MAQLTAIRPDETMAQTASFSPAVAQFAADVRLGLTRPGQKTLPCKYLYDDVGTLLFEAICALPEYGLSAADTRLLRAHAEEITSALTAPVMVAELGSGSASKTRWLLEALSRQQFTLYCPIEISVRALERSARELAGVRGLTVRPLASEFLEGLEAAEKLRPRDCGLFVLFLGSSIGNFDTPREFLAEVRARMHPGDSLLIGADLDKDEGRLRTAYNDPAGVTAAFNRNLLSRINRELGGTFDLSQFRHEARYNTKARRVEMHLRSLSRQSAAVTAAHLKLTLEEGETIWTESCRKFVPGEIAALGADAGFRLRQEWCEPDWAFTESLLLAV